MRLVGRVIKKMKRWKKATKTTTYQDHLVHSCPGLVWIWLTQIGWSEINYDLEESLLHKVGVEEERHIDINESKYFVTFLEPFGGAVLGRERAFLGDPDFLWFSFSFSSLFRDL